jgi:hypothetical protein
LKKVGWQDNLVVPSDETVYQAITLSINAFASPFHKIRITAGEANSVKRQGLAKLAVFFELTVEKQMYDVGRAIWPSQSGKRATIG